jgi:O-antigen/teichoic acid export membrane protein
LSLSGGAITVAVGASLTRVASLAVTVALAHSLTRTDFGGYQQLLLIVGIVSPLLLGGVPAALTYFLARAGEEADRRRFTCDAYLALSVLGLVFAALVVITRRPVADAVGNPDLVGALPLFAPYTLFTFIAAVMPSALITTGWAQRSAVMSALAAFVSAAVMVPAGILAHDLVGVALALTISSAIGCGLSVAAVVKTIGLRLDWVGLVARARRFLGYGLPLALVGVAGTLGYQFDRLVVTSNFSTDDFAIYAAGAVELPFVPIIQQSVNSVLLPELTRRYRDGDLRGVHELWREAIRKTSLILLPAFIFSLVLAGDIVAVLYGAQYERSTEVLRIYLLLLPIRVATYGLIPMAIGRPRINLAASIVYLASNALFALALVGPLGLVGPAVGTVLADIAIVSFYLLRLRALLGSPVRSLFPWRVIVKNLGVSAAAGAVIVPFAVVDLPAFVALLCAGPLYVAACALLMRQTGSITDVDWTRIRHAARQLGVSRR